KQGLSDAFRPNQDELGLVVWIEIGVDRAVAVKQFFFELLDIFSDVQILGINDPWLHELFPRMPPKHSTPSGVANSNFTQLYRIVFRTRIFASLLRRMRCERRHQYVRAFGGMYSTSLVSV